MMKIYHNPRCRKSRETLGILQDKGIDIEIVEYLKKPPTKEELVVVLKYLNIPAEAIIRKGESVFKDNYKGKTLTESEWIEVLIRNPVLIERPIVINGDKAVIGRPPENVLELL
ncbi:arsenate reductase (glutaredoxin) [Sphingobacteriaceae bacterium AH-315-L07]|nr:arsenate reductase (glutaredoxin) [Sphingobacteriaceae bacterium AH-315-L07]